MKPRSWFPAASAPKASSPPERITSSVRDITRPYANARRLEDDKGVLITSLSSGFPAAKGDGHHLVNKGKAWAVYLEVGNRSLDDETTYPDIDLFLTSGRHGKQRFTKKNGEPY